MLSSMNERISEDLAEMEKKLGLYVERGRTTGAVDVREEPAITVKPDRSLIKPLKKLDRFEGQFLAVDCSTRTLKRANNWGIYLMRAAYACVHKRNVDWSYTERICTVVGDAYGRSNFLKDVRIELESQMALRLIENKTDLFYYDHPNSRSNFLLLDGGGYFGGDRKFRVSLYDKCENSGVNLLAISKNSPILHDEKGRDLIATTTILASYGTWVFHPVRKADKDQSLYGDISLVKLCEGSPRVFRCDIMDYLTNQEVSEILSPLTCISEDPRCVGYPITLWLAHEFSAPSESMLLFYLDQVDQALNNAGLLETLRREEFSCSFADEIHGIKHAFEWEWWGEQF